MSYRDKLKSRDPDAPRKLLALDGGGIRGAISIEILARIESLLRERHGKQLVLSDYFDYVGGTSTGAIIATCISLGMSVDDIRKFYVECGPQMFTRAGRWRRYVYHAFSAEPLAKKLKQVIGERTGFGDDRLQTLLMMVMRNATTDSPWPLSNNPAARYNDVKREDCNLELPLWQLVRASTAAPTYFPPEQIKLGKQDFLFVDGGITMYNNPAFQLFLMATTAPYCLNWATGKEKMLLVSIGTGTSPGEQYSLSSRQMHKLYNAKSLPSALMNAALNEQDALCRFFGDCLCGDPIDRELGGLQGATGAIRDKLFTYVRYNAALTEQGLAALGLSDIKPENVQMLDSVDGLPDLQRVGKAVAKRDVLPEHFKDFTP